MYLQEEASDDESGDELLQTIDEMENENQENEEDEEEASGSDDNDDSESEDDKPEDEVKLQLSAQGDFFTADMSGHAGLGENPYERVVPPRFADGGDAFMASMIGNYALEGKNEDGSPNGKFFMNESQAKQASSEVLKAHKKIDGKELDEYVKTYFQRTWNHFDINKDGMVGVDVMPQFMRFIASDQAMELN